MEIVYLRSAQIDYRWVHDYYTNIFPAGKSHAEVHFETAERILIENPAIGRPISQSGIRELVIPRTPFSLIYRIKPDQIEVLRIWDGRADRSALDIQ